MHTFVKNAVSGLMLSALFLLVLSVPVRAQVLARSGEAAATFGYDYTSMTSVNPPSNILPHSHYFVSGSGGYNVTPYITALGEYKFDPLVSASGSSDSWHSQLAGAAARFNFTPSKKIVPYAIVGAGYYRLTVKAGSAIEVADSYYVNGGGGASIYCGKHWGIRPEFRYERQHAVYFGQIITSNVADVSGSIFYQFGGTGKKKK